MTLGEGSIVTPPVMSWAIRGRSLFYIVEGKEFPAKKFAIIANGTQDICIIEDPKASGQFMLTQMPEEPEDVVWKPDGDIIMVEFHEALPQSEGGRTVLYMEAKSMEPLIEELMRRNQEYTGGKLYDAYLGKDYGWKDTTRAQEEKIT